MSDVQMADRVRRKTSLQRLREIDQAIEDNVRYYSSQPQKAIARRIRELESEWSMERFIETYMATDQATDPPNPNLEPVRALTVWPHPEIPPAAESERTDRDHQHDYAHAMNWHRLKRDQSSGQPKGGLRRRLQISRAVTK